MEDGHLEWKEKGSQISGNGAVFLFFHSFKVISVGRCWAGAQERNVVDAGHHHSSLHRTTYGQVWPGAGWNAEEKECSQEIILLGMLDGQVSAFGPVQSLPHLSIVIVSLS